MTTNFTASAASRDLCLLMTVADLPEMHPLSTEPPGRRRSAQQKKYELHYEDTCWKEITMWR